MSGDSWSSSLLVLCFVLLDVNLPLYHVAHSHTTVSHWHPAVRNCRAWTLQIAKKRERKSCESCSSFLSNQLQMWRTWWAPCLCPLSLFPTYLSIIFKHDSNFFCFLFFSPNNSENSKFKPCDSHHPAAVVWQDSQVQRSSCCWGICLRSETTAPSDWFFCTAQDPTSNSNGHWEDSHDHKTTSLSPCITLIVHMMAQTGPHGCTAELIFGLF